MSTDKSNEKIDNKSNDKANIAPQQKSVNLMNLSPEESLEILDKVTNTGLQKMDATYAVFAISKLKAVIDEYNEFKKAQAESAKEVAKE